MVAYSAEYYQKNKKTQNEARQKYAKEHEKFISVRLNKERDFDIVARLDAESNKMGYIKRLIRDDIQRTGWRVPLRETDPADLPPVQPPVQPVPTVDLSAEEEARKLLGL